MAATRRGLVAVVLVGLLGGGSASAPSPVALPAGPAHAVERAEAAQATARSATRAAPPDGPQAIVPRASAVRASPPPDQPVAPVGGLTQRQMDHAATIVAMGKRAGLPERAYVVAIATVLQESNLRNLANPIVPDSLHHHHDGTGSDHDSVGLFQQRPSAGWGTVAQLMDPAYAATKFYDALRQVPGWQDLPVTVAAQAVQVSAFPGHYAKHEPLARQIVAALT